MFHHSMIAYGLDAESAARERRDCLLRFLKAVDDGAIAPRHISQAAVAVDLVHFLLAELPESMHETKSLVLQVLGVAGAA